MQTASELPVDKLNAGDYYTGYICTDCFDYIRLDEPEVPREDPNWDTDKVENVIKSFSIGIGHTHDNEFDNRCWHKEHCDDMNGECCGEDDAKSFFNLHDCFCCSRAFGGDFMEITAVLAAV